MLAKYIKFLIYTVVDPNKTEYSCPNCNIDHDFILIEQCQSCYTDNVTNQLGWG
jgi:hypothetical protein